MSFLRNIYQKVLSDEQRFWMYKLRNPQRFEKLKSGVNTSTKGDFSLQGFTSHESIFIHITKSAGTSVALGLFGQLPDHYTARQYRVIFGRKNFNRYFKFCFVRNPWDRLYSAFSFLKDGGWDDKDAAWAQENLGSINDFNDFVVNWLTPERLFAHMHFWPQSHFICDSAGRPLIDYLGYFETIQEDYQVVAAKLGVFSDLAHKNASKRDGYQTVYTPESTQKVAQLYGEDIENFGYVFDDFSRKRVDKQKFLHAS